MKARCVPRQHGMIECVPLLQDTCNKRKRTTGRTEKDPGDDMMRAPPVVTGDAVHVVEVLGRGKGVDQDLALTHGQEEKGEGGGEGNRTAV